MSKPVIVINGKGGVGKDTLCQSVGKIYRIRNVSSIAPFRFVARLLGGGYEDKSEKGRKFLSDLKKASIEYNNFPITHLIDKYKKFLDDELAEVMFVHIREPEEIKKFKAEVPECKTLLIRSSRIKGDLGNDSDDNVEDYDYDYIYYNDLPLEEAESDFLRFFTETFMEGEST